MSFRYPAETGKPVFCFTTTYQKRRFTSYPKTTIYVDGPFFPDETLSLKENQRMLREQVYEAMTERSKKSIYEYRQYIKVAPDTAKAKPAPLPMPAGALCPNTSPPLRRQTQKRKNRQPPKSRYSGDAHGNTKTERIDLSVPFFFSEALYAFSIAS